jgi:hypothetical protein
LDWAEKKERGEDLRWVWDFGFLFFFSFFFNTPQPKTNPTKIMQHTYIILFRKNNQLIAYTKFPVNKLNVGQVLKL